MPQLDLRRRPALSRFWTHVCACHRSGYRALPFEIVLPGHGDPGGKDIYDEMLRYLEAAEQALEETQQSSAFRKRMIERFPEYAGFAVLDHQLRFLFPEMNHA